MKLTLDQLQYIRDAIVKVGRVKYQDFFEEIYDHYISSIEADMHDGKDFQTAFVKVHESFLEYEFYFEQKNDWGIKLNAYTYYGLEALQMEYLDKLNKQIYRRYWTILRGLFGWPTVISTLLLGILILLISKNIEHKYISNIVISLATYMPFTLILFHGLKPWWQYTTGKRLLRQSIKGIAVVRMLGYSSLIWYAPALLCEIFLGKYLWEDIPIILFVILLWSYMLLIISFLQLYREQFKVKLT